MKNITTALVFLSLWSFSCKENTENTDTNIAEETTEHPYLVNNTNKAWAGEELNKRVSPPKSVLEETESGFKMAVHYSSPFVKNRTIWDSLVPYNTVWRTGANEATIIEFSNDVIIQNQEVPAGSYALFTLPMEDKFTVILNAVFDQWGAYEYDENKDVLRFEVEAQEKVFTESLVFDLSAASNAIELSFAWENRGFGFSARPKE